MSSSRAASFRCEKLSPAAVRFVVSTGGRPSAAYGSGHHRLGLLLSCRLYIRVLLLLSAVGLLTYIVEERHLTQDTSLATVASSTDSEDAGTTLPNDEFFLHVYLTSYLPWVANLISSLSLIKGLWYLLRLVGPVLSSLAEAWRALFYCLGDMLGIGSDLRVPLPFWLGLVPQIDESPLPVNSTDSSSNLIAYGIENYLTIDSIIRRTFLAWILVSVYIIFVCYICLRRSSKEDSMLVMQSIGIQLASQGRTFLSDKSTFIPASSIEEIYIHEAFYGQAIVFFLAIQRVSPRDLDASTSEMAGIPDEGNSSELNGKARTTINTASRQSEITVVFPQLLPRRAILEQVWRESRKCLFRDRPEKLKLLSNVEPGLN